MTVMMVVMVVVVILLSLELLAHIVGILTVSVVLGLNIVDLVAKGLGVEVKGSTVAAANMEGDVLSTEYLLHGVLSGSHELCGKAEFAMGAEDSEGGNVAVALGRLLLHLGEDVSYNLASVVLSDVEELRP